MSAACSMWGGCAHSSAGLWKAARGASTFPRTRNMCPRMYGIQVSVLQTQHMSQLMDHHIKFLFGREIIIIVINMHIISGIAIWILAFCDSSSQRPTILDPYFSRKDLQLYRIEVYATIGNRIPNIYCLQSSMTLSSILNTLACDFNSNAILSSSGYQ